MKCQKLFSGKNIIRKIIWNVSQIKGINIFQCFEDFLRELIGDDIIGEFKKKYVGEYLDIFKEFEVLI